MIQDCQFDKFRDIEPVAPDGALDLCAAYALGSVPSTLESQDSDYNGIEDPQTIIGKTSDVFEALQADKVIESRGKKEDNK